MGQCAISHDEFETEVQHHIAAIAKEQAMLNGSSDKDGGVSNASDGLKLPSATNILTSTDVSSRGSELNNSNSFAPNKNQSSNDHHQQQSTQQSAATPISPTKAPLTTVIHLPSSPHQPLPTIESKSSSDSPATLHHSAEKKSRRDPSSYMHPTGSSSSSSSSASSSASSALAATHSTPPPHSKRNLSQSNANLAHANRAAAALVATVAPTAPVASVASSSSNRRTPSSTLPLTILDVHAEFIGTSPSASPRFTQSNDSRLAHTQPSFFSHLAASNTSTPTTAIPPPTNPHVHASTRPLLAPDFETAFFIPTMIAHKSPRRISHHIDDDRSNHQSSHSVNLMQSLHLALVEEVSAPLTPGHDNLSSVNNSEANSSNNSSYDDTMPATMIKHKHNKRATARRPMKMNAPLARTSHTAAVSATLEAASHPSICTPELNDNTPIVTSHHPPVLASIQAKQRLRLAEVDTSPHATVESSPFNHATLDS